MAEFTTPVGFTNRYGAMFNTEHLPKIIDMRLPLPPGVYFDINGYKSPGFIYTNVGYGNSPEQCTISVYGCFSAETTLPIPARRYYTQYETIFNMLVSPGNVYEPETIMKTYTFSFTESTPPLPPYAMTLTNTQTLGNKGKLLYKGNTSNTTIKSSKNIYLPAYEMLAVKILAYRQYEEVDKSTYGYVWITTLNPTFEDVNGGITNIYFEPAIKSPLFVIMEIVGSSQYEYAANLQVKYVPPNATQGIQGAIRILKTVVGETVFAQLGNIIEIWGLR